jgi:pimeloyl-ACP methyl ester carboxylesterase
MLDPTGDPHVVPLASAVTATRRMRWKVVAVSLAIVFQVSACTFGLGKASPTSRPTFTRADCPVEITSLVLVDVSCGTLTVPQHHEEPDRGTLELFVTRMEPDASSPSPDPVLYLGGDLGVAPDYATLGNQVGGLGREVIVMEARGTGHSQPSLLCPDVDALPKPPVASPVDDARTRAELLGAIGACRDRLVSEGVDLSAFDLREMARDAEDLRTALGIDRWNVMALGTASRIALEYLREYPATIRAAVLDSPEWPGVDPFVESVLATRGAIAQLVSACAASRGCDRETPHLKADISAVTRSLAAEPFEADASKVRQLDGTGESGRVLFDAGWFLVWLRARLSAIEPPGTYVPHAIAAFAHDSRGVLRLEATRLLDRQLCEGFLPSPCETNLVMSFGTYLSVMCRDVIPFTDRSRLAELVAGDGSFQEAFGDSPYLGACDVWDAGEGEPEAAASVTTDVPTLVLVGRFDPFSAVPDARRATLSMRGASVIVSPVSGHQVTGTGEAPGSCMVRVRDRWLEQPAAEPNLSCVHRLHMDFSLPLDWNL